jgi:hypothetical protein
MYRSRLVGALCALFCFMIGFITPVYAIEVIKYRKRFLRSCGGVALALGMSIAGKAHAAPVLPDLTVSGHVALGAASNEVNLIAPGTISLPPPYNYGTATLTAVAGSIPGVSIDTMAAYYQGISGGGGQVTMTYHMMYYNPSVAGGTMDGTTIGAMININEVVTQSGPSKAEAKLTVGGTQNVGGLSPIAYQGYDCVVNTAVYAPCSGGTVAPFPSGPITLEQNRDYTVFLQVTTAGTFYLNENGTAHASINLWFSAPPSGGGEFIFSPDITSVPAPPAVWLFGSGLLGLIGIARHKKVA